MSILLTVLFIIASCNLNSIDNNSPVATATSSVSPVSLENEENLFPGSKPATSIKSVAANTPTPESRPASAPFTENQSYIGTWYVDNDMLDYLKIVEITTDTVNFEMSIYRLTAIYATANVENNEIVFGENISSDYDGPALNGTLEFYEDSISVIIDESEFEYIEAGTTYDFTIVLETP